MRYRTKPIQLEAVKYDGRAIPDFARGKTSSRSGEQALDVDTDEGERVCRDSDYFVLTDGGQSGNSLNVGFFEPHRDVASWRTREPNLKFRSSPCRNANAANCHKGLSDRCALATASTLESL